MKLIFFMAGCMILAQFMKSELSPVEIGDDLILVQPIVEDQPIVFQAVASFDDTYIQKN